MAKITQRRNQWLKTRICYIIWSQLCGNHTHTRMPPPPVDIESQKVGVVDRDYLDAGEQTEEKAEYRTLSLHADDSTQSEKGKQVEKRKGTAKGNEQSLIWLFILYLHNSIM